MVTEKSALSAAPVVTIGMQVIKKIKFNRTKSANVSRNRTAYKVRKRGKCLH